MTSRRLKGSERARFLVAYLEGEVTASERAAIEAELEESASARRMLGELEAVTALLGAPAPELEAMDLAGRVQGALRRPSSPRAATPVKPSAWKSRSMTLAVGLAAALGVGLLLVRSPERPEEFRAKSNASAGIESRRWAGVRAYRVAGQKSPEPLGTTLHASDGLVFSYTNLGAHAFGYLMIFGVDANGDVRWFYPAYLSAAENPQSIPIERNRANVALGEVVEQDFAAGPLTLYALFSDARADVRSIERWVKERERGASESPLTGGLLQRIDTRVEP